MGNLIAVGNLKGGTGKSTIAVNLACALADDGASVVLVDADAQGTAIDWHAGNRLPVPVEALPLGGERDAQRWVARVIRLKAAADHVVVDLPPQVGSGIASALLIADLFVDSGDPVRGRSAGDRQGARPVAPGARGARRRQARLHAGAEPGRPAHRRSAAGSTPRSSASASRSARRSASARRMSRRSSAGAWIGAHAPGSPGHREIRVLKDRILELLAETAPRPRPRPRRASLAVPPWATPRGRRRRPRRRGLRSPRLLTSRAAPGAWPGGIAGRAPDAHAAPVRPASAIRRSPGWRRPAPPPRSCASRSPGELSGAAPLSQIDACPADRLARPSGAGRAVGLRAPRRDFKLDAPVRPTGPSRHGPRGTAHATVIAGGSSALLAGPRGSVPPFARRPRRVAGPQRRARRPAEVRHVPAAGEGSRLALRVAGDAPHEARRRRERASGERRLEQLARRGAPGGRCRRGSGGGSWCRRRPRPRRRRRRAPPAAATTRPSAARPRGAGPRSRRRRPCRSSSTRWSRPRGPGSARGSRSTAAIASNAFWWQWPCSSARRQRGDLSRSCEPARGLLLPQELLEQQGALGDRLGLRPRQQRRDTRRAGSAGRRARGRSPAGRARPAARARPACVAPRAAPPSTRPTARKVRPQQSGRAPSGAGRCTR